jgi:hypothetical protein
MKKQALRLALLALIFSVFFGVYAQENNVQLFLVGEENIKPGMIEQYYKLSGEFLELCKEMDFPYPYNLWSTSDFTFYLWYPIDNLSDVEKIEKAWDEVVEKMGDEKYSQFQACINYQKEQVVARLNDLCYVPESPRVADDETNFCYWQELYLQKGSEKEVKDLIKKANVIMEEKGLEDASYWGEGRMGWESPVYFVWGFGKSVRDYWEQHEKDAATIAEDFKEINQELMKHIRKNVNKSVWWIENLSYIEEDEAP